MLIFLVFQHSPEAYLMLILKNSYLNFVSQGKRMVFLKSGLLAFDNRSIRGRAQYQLFLLQSVWPTAVHIDIFSLISVPYIYVLFALCKFLNAVSVHCDFLTCSRLGTIFMLDIFSKIIVSYFYRFGIYSVSNYSNNLKKPYTIYVRCNIGSHLVCSEAQR